MAILRIDGFDNYRALDSSLTGANLPGTAYSFFSNGGTSPIRTAPGVTAGSMAFQFARGSTFYSNMNYQFSSNADKVVLGFAFFGNQRAPLLRINSELTVDWDVSGPMGLNGELGPNVIVLARWYYLEVVIDRIANMATLFINDTQYVQIALPAALESASNWSVVFGWSGSGGAGTMRFDDLLVLDSSDTSDGVTDRLGPVEHKLLTAQTAPVTGFDNPTALTPVEVANNVPPQDSVFLESATSGARALFNRSDFEDERPILAVALSGVLSKTDLDERQLGLVVVDGNGEQEDTFELGLTFAYYQSINTSDSQGAPWTAATLNAADWGVVVRP